MNRIKYHIIKMLVVSKLIYTFNAISIKIATGFLIELDKVILKFIWKK